MQFPQDIKQVTIDGYHLTLEQFIAVAQYGAQVRISAESEEKMRRSRETVERIIKSGKPAYGINTGFGSFSKIAIPENDANALQNNLIVSHSTAVGNPYPEEAVRGMLLLRANALCAGCSGIRPEIVQALADMLNRGVHPVVPEKGSLGASGDLAPLSHMALVLIGRGEAIYKGRRMPGGEAMREAGLPTFSLLAKEGLALINGTQAMNSVGALSLYAALRAARMADIIASVTFEALNGQLNAFEARVHEVRPHAGQALTARNFRLLLKDSPMIARAQGFHVQNAYALRCIPQVHGAVRGALAHIREVVETEMNAVTDNPLVFSQDDSVISCGNFHGEPLAFAFDYLGIVASELANISERRIERMVNPALSDGLPAFLVKEGGLNSGFMICQYSAASMVSENKVLAHPASVDSIPSSANQEDHVSMGATSARKAAQIVDNVLSVLAFELMAAVQAAELRNGTLSPAHEEIIRLVRKQIPFYDRDREIRLDIEKANRLVRDDAILRATARLVPGFE